MTGDMTGDKLKIEISDRTERSMNKAERKSRNKTAWETGMKRHGEPG